jgi:hypothetical protein
MIHTAPRRGDPMLLFTRTTTLVSGSLAEGLEYAAARTGLRVVAWAGVYGTPLSTVTWSAGVRSHAAIGDAFRRLGADAEFRARVRQAASLVTGPAEDAIGEVLASTDGLAAHQYASVTTAQCAAGRIAEAMAWGVDTMQHVSKLTGFATSVVRGLYGPFSTLAWITSTDTLAEVDAADVVTSSDPTYVERVDQAGELFLTGSARQQLVRRLA